MVHNKLYKKKTLQCSNGLIQSLTQQPKIADVANFVQLGKCKVKFKASVYMLVNCGDQWSDIFYSLNSCPA